MKKLNFKKNASDNASIKTEKIIENENAIKLLTGESKPRSIIAKIKAFSTLSKVLIIAAIILAIYIPSLFLLGKAAAGIVSLIQLLLCVLIVLKKENKISFYTDKVNRILLAVLLALIIPFFIFISLGGTENGTEYNWNDIALNQYLPQPASNSAYITSNDSENLDMTLYEIGSEDYGSYLEKCKNLGYTTESEQTQNGYSAYGSEGYKLNLYYYQDDKKLDISLIAPMRFVTIQWPQEGMASLLPAPESTSGKVETDSENLFSVYIGNMPLDSFLQYCEACKANGFNNEVSNVDKQFQAKNSDGYLLNAQYTGNSVVQITVTPPEYNINVEVESVSKALFSTYDIVVYVDGVEQCTVENDSENSFDIVLKKAKHNIKFVNADDESIYGEVNAIISKDETLKFKINSNSDSIEVETLAGTIDLKIESIEFSDDSDVDFYSIDTEKQEKFSVKADTEVPDIENYLEFVSDNPKVAEISYDSTYDYSDNVNIKAIGNGETYVYIQSKDKSVTSQKIKVTVDAYEDETTEATTAKKKSKSTETTTKKKKSRTVYTTPYGEKYHYSKSCAGKNAIEKELDDVKDIYEPCKKCVG